MNPLLISVPFLPEKGFDPGCGGTGAINTFFCLYTLLHHDQSVDIHLFTEAWLQQDTGRDILSVASGPESCAQSHTSRVAKAPAMFLPTALLC
jgi:hypothetical protein